MVPGLRSCHRRVATVREEHASALVLCLACGCGAGPSATDAGGADASVDAGLADGAEGGTDTGSHDGGTVTPPDADAARVLLCEEGGAPEPSAPCEIQDPGLTDSCGGRGGVVFDGRSCALATGTECSDPIGAFDSFEACALACAAAGQCDRTKFLEWGSSCDTVWLGFRYSPVPDTACSLANEWDCMEPPPPEAEPHQREPGRRCWQQSVRVDDSFLEEACALTLLPSIGSLDCFNAL